MAWEGGVGLPSGFGIIMGRTDTVTSIKGGGMEM